MKTVTSVKLTCGTCGVKAVGHAGHVDRRHQACGGRVKGSGLPRKDCGTWNRG